MMTLFDRLLAGLFRGVRSTLEWNTRHLGLPVAAFMLGVCLTIAASPRLGASAKAEPKLAHMVFFTLKDHSPEARETFVASCRKYLTGHRGAEFLAIGTIAEDVVEPGVSIRDFDVALHVVFESKAAEAKYLKAPRHVEFVDKNRASFEKVRVFDSYVAQP